jgi:hypothetical protein
MAIVETRAITGGVDTHADMHVAAALDPVGGLLGVREFPVSAAGYGGLLGWLGGFGTVCLVGIEGTGSYGVGENVAVFGDFRYKLNSLGKVVSSPFSILVKVVDGKVTYLQFLEDSYATAASFRKDGSWTVQTQHGAEPFQV